MPTLFSTGRQVDLPNLRIQALAAPDRPTASLPTPTHTNPITTTHRGTITMPVSLKKTPKTTVTTKPKAKHTPTIIDLPYGATSAYTACRDCGQRFTQRNANTRFRALARHYNDCNG